MVYKLCLGNFVYTYIVHKYTHTHTLMYIYIIQFMHRKWSLSDNTMWNKYQIYN